MRSLKKFISLKLMRLSLSVYLTHIPRHIISWRLKKKRILMFFWKQDRGEKNLSLCSSWWRIRILSIFASHRGLIKKVSCSCLHRSLINCVMCDKSFLHLQIELKVKWEKNLHNFFSLFFNTAKMKKLRRK
jgi:hypothetical protein